MKPSIYNKVVPYKDSFLLFNQVTGALIKTSKKIFEEVNAVFNGDFSNEKLSERLRTFGYLIEDQDDERLKLKKIYDSKVNNNLNKHLFITVTDRCNLGCHYCFEEKNQWIKMSLETQEQLKLFSEKFLLETKTNFFGIGWYGGEPTMHMSAVENLSKFYTKFCQENNINFYQMMITNGTTLTDAICNKLINLNIKRIQVTVDGYKSDHDNNRPYLKDIKYEEASEIQKKQLLKTNPNLLLNIIDQNKEKTKSSYEEILKGIEKYVVLGGEVSLRMNVNNDTISRVPMLLDDLLSKKLFEKNQNGGYVYAYAHPIYDGSCGSNSDNGNCGSCKISSMMMESFAKKLDIVKEWYKKNNIEYFDHSVQMKFTGDTCTANKKYEFVINPDGSITKCTHDVGKKEKTIGHIRDMETDPEKMFIKQSFLPILSIDKFNPFEDEECYNCEVLPLCVGGCKSNNNVGNNKNYEAGCSTVRYTLAKEIIDLYEKNEKIRGGCF